MLLLHVVCHLKKLFIAKYFGLRFDRFMDAMDINDQNIRREIRRIKGERYPYYFDYLKGKYSPSEAVALFQGAWRSDCYRINSQREESS